MKQLQTFYVWLLLISIGIATPYVPTTWINGAPNNLYTPICLTNVHKEKNKYSLWPTEAKANLFALTQGSNFLHERNQAIGLGLQGRLQLDPFLHGLYTEMYACPLMNHQEGFDLVKQKLVFNNEISLADTYLLMGWQAVNKRSFSLSGYAFGIIPATKNALLDHNKIIYWVGLDDHFAWGLGIDSSVHLVKNPHHTLDLLIDTDVTFLESRTEMAWTNNNGIYEPYQIALSANYLYKIRSAIAYQYKHFISDLGVQFFYTPRLTYHGTDNLLKKILEPSTHWGSLFCDIGMDMHFDTIRSYLTLGAQTTQHNHGFDSWNATLKLGVTV